MTKPEIEPGQPLPFLKNGIAQVAILVEDLEKTVENIGPCLASDRGISIRMARRVLCKRCAAVR